MGLTPLLGGSYFHALDREKDTALVLLAASPHKGKLRSVTSRAIRWDVKLRNSSDMMAIRSAFAEVAAHRRASRSASLLKRACSPQDPRNGLLSGSTARRIEEKHHRLDEDK